MDRVLIIGFSGTGKSTFARHLSAILKLPLHHLDQVFWKDNWIEQDPHVVENEIQHIISGEQWIVEGYIEPLSRERIRRADVVVYLDFSGALVFWRGIKRWLQHRDVSRPEMPYHNTDTLGPRFLKSMLYREERPEIERALLGSEDKIVRLRNPRYAEQYLLRLRTESTDA